MKLQMFARRVPALIYSTRSAVSFIWLKFLTLSEILKITKNHINPDFFKLKINLKFVECKSSSKSVENQLFKLCF